MIATFVITEGAEGNRVTEKRLFGSMTRELHALAQWLSAARSTAVPMEATPCSPLALGSDLRSDHLA